MKTEFRTIEIEKFLVSIFGMFVICFLLQRVFKFNPEMVYFVFLFIPLSYYVFSGKVSLKFNDSDLEIHLVRQAFHTSSENLLIHYSNIIRWNYTTSGLGADAIKIYMECGRKIQIVPSIVNTQDLGLEVFRKLGSKISQYHTETAADSLKKKILTSAYYQKLEKKINSTRRLIWVFAGVDVAILGLAVVFPNPYESNLLWVIFLTLSGLTVILSFRTHFLKNEKQNLLNWG